MKCSIAVIGIRIYTVGLIAVAAFFVTCDRAMLFHWDLDSGAMVVTTAFSAAKVASLAIYRIHTFDVLVNEGSMAMHTLMHRRHLF